VKKNAQRDANTARWL